jgi:hydrogenase maturation protease
VEIIVAGFGNLLRGDDGVGVVVAQRLLEAGAVPEGVRVLDIGIGGIHLVQELLSGCEALIVLDAVDLGRPPGTVVVQEPEVLDMTALPELARRDHLADMHYATPERTFVLARGLGVLPARTVLVGVQVQDAHRYGEGLTDTVGAAVPVAAEIVLEQIRNLGLPRPA